MMKLQLQTLCITLALAFKVDALAPLILAVGSGFRMLAAAIFQHYVALHLQRLDAALHGIG
jgi:hypothetical protein